MELLNWHQKLILFCTKQQQEIDYVEEAGGKITGFELKWNPKVKTNIPSNFIKTYNAEVTVISKENFREFVLKG